MRFQQICFGWGDHPRKAFCRGDMLFFSISLFISCFLCYGSVSSEEGIRVRASFPEPARQVRLGKWITLQILIEPPKDERPSVLNDQSTRFQLVVEDTSGFKLQRSISMLPAEERVKREIPLLVLSAFPVYRIRVLRNNRVITREQIRPGQVSNGNNPLIQPDLYQIFERPTWYPSQYQWFSVSILLLFLSLNGSMGLVYCLYMMEKKFSVISWSILILVPCCITLAIVVLKPERADGVLEQLHVHYESDTSGANRRKTIQTMFPRKDGSLEFPVENLQKMTPIFDRQKNVQTLFPTLLFRNQTWWYRWEPFPEDGFMVFQSEQEDQAGNSVEVQSSGQMQRTITNNGSSTFQAGFFVWQNRVVPSGVLAPGQSRHFSISEDGSVRKERLFSMTSVSGSGMNQGSKNDRRLRHFVNRFFRRGRRISRMVFRGFRYVLKQLPRRNLYWVGIHVNPRPDIRVQANLEQYSIGKIYVRRLKNSQ